VLDTFVFEPFVSGIFARGGGMTPRIRILLFACVLGCAAMTRTGVVEAADMRSAAGAEARVAAATSTGTVAPANDPRALDDLIQDLKVEVIELNRDLMVLEEELLFPANTQIAVFVSMDVGKAFSLDSVQLKIDNTEVANYLYSSVEVQALRRGGVQRLYLGNVRGGEHSLMAYLRGRGTIDNEYRSGSTMKFQKDARAKYLELQIKDDKGTLQPVFHVKHWQ
jgi:hypothetical protein